MQNRTVRTFMVALVASALVWVASPWLTGQREPWDADFPFYFVALLVAGAIAGIATPKPLWAHYIGSFIGQLSYQAIFLKSGPLIVLGALFLLGYCLMFVAAAWFTGYLRGRFKKAH